MPDRKEKRTLYILSFLGIYILFQVCWWGYSLVAAHRQLYAIQEQLSGNPQHSAFRQKVWMIIGEGSVFVLLLALGFTKIKRTISRELRLAEMEKTFLLSVTHELKTPIAAVKLFLETLRTRKLTPEQQEKLLGDALRETSRLQGLSENILLATRLDHTHDGSLNEKVDLSLMVRGEANRFLQLADNQRKFELFIDEGIRVRGDDSLLRSVFFNLIENAVKYSPLNSRIIVHLHQQNDRVIFSITDEGVGIPKEESKRIFEKFSRLGNEETRKHKGTGLGLYIVKSVVHLHNGFVHVSANHPAGCVFTVDLPVM